MDQLLDTGLKILAALAALLLGGGVLYLRGRSAGKASMPRPETVRAEERDLVHEEQRSERQADLQREVVRIRDETLGRIEHGHASEEDLAREQHELEAFRRGPTMRVLAALLALMLLASPAAAQTRTSSTAEGYRRLALEWKGEALEERARREAAERDAQEALELKDYWKDAATSKPEPVSMEWLWPASAVVIAAFAAGFAVASVGSLKARNRKSKPK